MSKCLLRTLLKRTRTRTTPRVSSCILSWPTYGQKGISGISWIEVKVKVIQRLLRSEASLLHLQLDDEDGNQSVFRRRRVRVCQPGPPSCWRHGAQNIKVGVRQRDQVGGFIPCRPSVTGYFSELGKGKWTNNVITLFCFMLLADTLS